MKMSLRFTEGAEVMGLGVRSMKMNRKVLLHRLSLGSAEDLKPLPAASPQIRLHSPAQKTPAVDQRYWLSINYSSISNCVFYL